MSWYFSPRIFDFCKSQIYFTNRICFSILHVSLEMKLVNKPTAGIAIYLPSICSIFISGVKLFLFEFVRMSVLDSTIQVFEFLIILLIKMPLTFKNLRSVFKTCRSLQSSISSFNIIGIGFSSILKTSYIRDIYRNISSCFDSSPVSLPFSHPPVLLLLRVWIFGYSGKFNFWHRSLFLPGNVSGTSGFSRRLCDPVRCICIFDNSVKIRDNCTNLFFFLSLNVSRDFLSFATVGLFNDSNSATGSWNFKYFAKFKQFDIRISILLESVELLATVGIDSESPGLESCVITTKPPRLDEAYYPSSFRPSNCEWTPFSFAIACPYTFYVVPGSTWICNYSVIRTFVIRFKIAPGFISYKVISEFFYFYSAGLFIFVSNRGIDFSSIVYKGMSSNFESTSTILALILPWLYTCILSCLSVHLYIQSSSTSCVFQNTQ